MRYPAKQRCLAHVAATTTLLVVVLAGCGGEPASERITRVGGSATKQRTSGQLSRAPIPLTLADLDRMKRDSPELVVATVWFLGQWGSSPSIIQHYHPAVRRAVGTEMLAGVFSQQRDLMLATRLHFTGTRTGRANTLVTVELQSATAGPRRESFLLRRVDGGWRIIHDSFLEQGIAGYVQGQVQNRIDPSARSPVPRAVAAGASSAARYRNLFIDR